MQNTIERLLLLAILSVAIAYCSPKQTLDRLPSKYLRFGSGGGVVGETTTWTLFPNGQLFRTRTLQPDTLEWQQHSRRTARRLFQEAEAMSLLDRPPFEHPGNRYYFVEWTEGERSQRITWGRLEHPVDSTIEALYQRLVALTRP